VPAKKIGKILFASGLFMLAVAVVLLITVGNVLWFISLCISVFLNIAGVHLLLFRSGSKKKEFE